MIEILVVIIGALLAMLGINAKRVQKRDQKIQDQSRVIEQSKKQEKILQEAGRIKDALRVKQKGNEAELETVVQAVQEIEDKEVPDEQKRKKKANLVNGLSAGFNNRARRVRDGK